MPRFFAIILALAIISSPARAAEVTTFSLDNGLDVVVLEDHRAQVVVHMVWYRVGAADEPPGKSGIAHFLEHLLFAKAVHPQTRACICWLIPGDTGIFLCHEEWLQLLLVEDRLYYREL